MLTQTETDKHPRLRQNLLILLLTVGVILDLAISVGLGYVTIQARNASRQAHIVKVAAYEACLANNDAKASDLKRWNAVLKLVEASPSTPQLKTFVAGVNRANTEADAPRNCGQIAP